MTPVPASSGGPWFEELEIGDTYAAPALTLTDGHRAVHQAILGDRCAALLDARLAAAVFGVPRPLGGGLVIDVAIGQSSVVTRRVRANLFYRGLSLHRTCTVGDTLHTTTTIVGLRQNRDRPDRPPTGLAALRIRTVDQNDRLVLDFHRCAMLPRRDAAVATGHDDDLSKIGSAIDLDELGARARAWDLAALEAHGLDGPGWAELAAGDRWTIDDADLVAETTALARLTLNVAAIHHDRRGTPDGRRLVYGGHTIGLAAHQATRALPRIVEILGWHRCDHTAPVHEGDQLTSTLEVHERHAAPLVTLRSLVTAHGDGESRPVLDWSFLAAVA